MFGIVTLGGVVVVSGTVFGIMVSLCCITLGDLSLMVTTFLVMASVTYTFG